jgi:hypothetical protein
MKNYIYLLFILVFFVRCEESELTSFKEKDAIYFQLQETDYTKHFSSWDDWLNYEGDSIVYNFKGHVVDNPDYLEKDTVWLQVNLLGQMSPQERYFNVRVNQNQTSAEEGLHYEALDSQYTLGADTIRASFPVVLFNYESLGTEPYTLDVVIESNATFDLGLEGRTNARFLIYNDVVKPVIWDQYYYSYLGPYSKAKHRIVILTNGGVTVPNTYEEYEALRASSGYNVVYYWKTPMNAYLEANKVYDENGNRVQPW